MALTAVGPAWRKSVTCVGEITPAALADTVTNWFGPPGAAFYNPSANIPIRIAGGFPSLNAVAENERVPGRLTEVCNSSGDSNSA